MIILTPNRLEGLIKKIEEGATPEEITQSLESLLLLQPLDMAVAGREFVEHALQAQEQKRADFAKLLDEILD